MVSTMRIASVAAVILAGVLLASVTGFASLKTLNASNDEELSRILGAPSVVEKFRENQGDKAQSRQDAISPLVMQAEAFGLYLDPPVSAGEPTRIARREREIPQRPVTPGITTLRFDLLGTSYSPASQGECFAYIRLHDGKTTKWVRIGEMVGQMRIKEIRRDSVVCWDGSRDVTEFVPQRTDMSSSLEAGVSSVTAASSGVRPSAADRITAGTSFGLLGDRPERPELSTKAEEEEANLGRLVDRINASANVADKEALLNRLREGLQAARERSEASSEGEPNGSGVSPLQRPSAIRSRLGVSR